MQAEGCTAVMLGACTLPSPFPFPCCSALLDMQLLGRHWSHKGIREGKVGI